MLPFPDPQHYCTQKEICMKNNKKGKSAKASIIGQQKTGGQQNVQKVKEKVEGKMSEKKKGK